MVRMWQRIFMGINTSLCLNPELHILPVNSLQDKNSWDDSRTQEFLYAG